MVKPANLDKGEKEIRKVENEEKKPGKKRPWRNKLRRDAKKQAEKAVKELNKSSEPTMVLPTEEPKKKKKKKKQKKVKIIEEQQNTSEIESGVKDIVEEYKKKLESGRFRYLNEQLYTMTGNEALEFFKEDPDAFDCYHKGFAEQAKKWPNHPLQHIVKWLKALPQGKIVYDLGCGEAKIAEAISDFHKVRSFDLVAVNDRVTACDMAHLPVDDSSADIVIFCLSLMGTNITDFIKEARRALKLGGTLKIAEVTSRFINIKMFSEAICKMGFEQLDKRKATEYFIMLEFKKVTKVENKRPFGLKLKPCVYKKR